jgi:two-component system sensor histidine kinase RegB
MTSFVLSPLSRDSRSGWVRLRTLIALRWMAIGGQVAAIVVASAGFGLMLPLWHCALAIAASALLNLLVTFRFPPNKRLSEAEALLTLLFDLAQLAFLVAITGGLTNPFVLLILAPVTISASALELRTTLVLGTAAVLFVTLVALLAPPLRLADGTLLLVPELFTFGFWLSIVIGILFLGLYTRRVAMEIRAMADALLAAQMALAREQKLTDLGGVVAAAAHELGTPLATIKLVSAEMIDELADHPDLREDATLIRDQADRCRDILRSMGQVGKDDLHLRQAPFSTVIREAAEPHLSRGKEVVFAFHPHPGGDERQPSILRRPELIHGVRNLVQNAVDFARARVWVDGNWTDDALFLRIADDGEGFPPQMIGRIGDPFMRFRRPASVDLLRPEYEGMGLGLFIAKTLLERTGAEMTFSNGSDPFLTTQERPERCGAVVVLRWNAADLIPASGSIQGENPRFPR